MMFLKLKTNTSLFQCVNTEMGLFIPEEEGTYLQVPNYCGSLPNPIKV